VARDLYQLESGITDVRVCHPACGRVCFIITFLTRGDLQKFQAGPEVTMRAHLAACTCGGGEGGEGKHASLTPEFECTGTLMPAAHSLPSLLAFLRENVVGSNYCDHDVKRVADQCQRWFPREEEYRKYVHWDPHDSSKVCPLSLSLSLSISLSLSLSIYLSISLYLYLSLSLFPLNCLPSADHRTLTTPQSTLATSSSATSTSTASSCAGPLGLRVPYTAMTGLVAG
jgi:hypothetical protein